MKTKTCGRVTGPASPIGGAYRCFTRVGSRFNVKIAKDRCCLLPIVVKTLTFVNIVSD